jgi:hypothetical protein
LLALGQPITTSIIDIFWAIDPTSFNWLVGLKFSPTTTRAFKLIYNLPANGNSKISLKIWPVGGEKNTKRFSILWLLAIVAFLGYATIARVSEVPANLSNLSLVADEEVATVSVVLLLLAFLSLILKGSANRLTNIIAGSVFGLGALMVLVDGVTVNLYGLYNPMMGAMVICMVLVVWFAHKMPKLQT